VVGGAQRPQDLPHPGLPDPQQAGHIGEREPLAALGLPQPPQLLDPLGAGEGAASERGQGAADIVLAHPDLPGHGGRVQRLITGDLTLLVALLDALQRRPCWVAVVAGGSAAAGVGGLQRLELLGGRSAVAGRLRS
jgi:hypothetical protein